MNPKKYEANVLASVERRLALSRKKRADYADDEDVLANFKRLGEVVKILRINILWEKQPALAYAIFMDIMKVDRLVNLLNKSTAPANESIQDSWDDHKNYADLAEALYQESNETPKVGLDVLTGKVAKAYNLTPLGKRVLELSQEGTHSLEEIIQIVTKEGLVDKKP